MVVNINTPRPHSDYPYDLGTYSRPVTTKSLDAQVWFDRGLNWAYAFNHLESARCFEHAIAHDPNCAMAYWGLAYTSGPNYNKAWELFDADDLRDTLRKVRSAVIAAGKHSSEASDVERALIVAIGHRYPEGEGEDYGACNEAYARAMEKVYRLFKDDIDVKALYADALMNLAPWDLWDIKLGEPRPLSRTLDAKNILESALSQQPLVRHPGILHLYTHLMEMSPTPELALRASNRLRGLVPDGGHLEHMPSHLDLLVGDYRSAVQSNLAAIVADEKYARQTSSLDFYTFYRLHNYNTLIYAAMLGGQFEIAMEGVRGMELALPEKLLRVKSPPMADWLEVSWATRAHVLVRFGRWQDLIDLSLPADEELYSVTIATIHYAKGIAYSATNNVPEAANQQALFLAALGRIPPSRLDFPNTCADVLQVGRAMLDGEIEYRRGNFEVAFERLRESIRLYDSLTYTEPWSWKQPPRHAYAALQLEQGNVKEAAATYAADLGYDDTLCRQHQHPNNVWALHGYHECLVLLGRANEAKLVKQQLTLALALADVPVTASCYCRNTESSSSSSKITLTEAKCQC